MYGNGWVILANWVCFEKRNFVNTEIVIQFHGIIFGTHSFTCNSRSFRFIRDFRPSWSELSAFFSGLCGIFGGKKKKENKLN